MIKESPDEQIELHTISLQDCKLLESKIEPYLLFTCASSLCHLAFCLVHSMHTLLFVE